MSVLCPSSPEYRTSAEQKWKSKNAAKVYRYGTPKLRDVLREVCTTISIFLSIVFK